MRFEKVSYEQFEYDYCYIAGVTLDENTKKMLKEVWNNIKLPKRGTGMSAGFDFFLPYTLTFTPEQEVIVPTGIRFDCDSDKFLLCAPRSGLGFKYGMKLVNTVGIIDADYYQSDNEGHIMAKISVSKSVQVDTGKGFMQGIILPYFVTDDDSEDAVRNGGFGSTGV